MSAAISDASSTWFPDLVKEALKERGFKPNEGASRYSHRSCPAAEFEFVWTEVSSGLVTGNAIWSVDDVSECVSLHKLQKLDPLKKDVIKIQIVDNLLLRCLSSCQMHLYGAPQQGLLALPAEVTMQILENLPAASLCSLAVLHPSLKFLTSEPELWERLFKKDFPLAKPIATPNANWKELYKTEYLAGRAIYRRPAIFPIVRRPNISEVHLGPSYFNDLDFYREHARCRAGLLRLI